MGAVKNSVIPTGDNEIVKVLMARDGMERDDAIELVAEAIDRVLVCGENPEDILYEEFGLEPDYIFSLIPI